MSSRVTNLAKPRANALSRARTGCTTPAAFRPLAVSEIEIDIEEVVEVQVPEALPRFASIPDSFPAFDDYEATALRRDLRDNSFDATVRKPSTRDRASKATKSAAAERVAAARPNRLFDAPFAHQVATTPPSTFASRPMAPLARARNTVPPAAPSSTGQSLSPMTFSADDSGYHATRVGGPTVLVPRAAAGYESNSGVPSWLYAGVAAAVLIAGSLFAIGGRSPAESQASAAQGPAVAQLQQTQQPQVRVQVAPASPRVQLAPLPSVDPVLAAALAAPVTAPAPQALPASRVDQPLAPSNASPTAKPTHRFASSHGTHASPAPAVVPVAPRPIAAPAAVAMTPVEGGHDVRTSQQTSAAASKVIGDSL